jgi:glycosyltransferase involved in cell wall biosynthesis
MTTIDPRSGADPAAIAPAAAPPPRARVLVVGPLPPPLGGVQLMNQMLLHSSLAQEFELSVVDTSRGALRWAVERPSWRSPLLMVRDLSRLLAGLARVRPAIVYVHAASGYSFIRDAALMALARISGARVVCHYHGTTHTVFPSADTRSGRLAGRWLMWFANRVIVLGPTYQARMGAAWHRHDVEWSPNLVDVERFRPRVPSAKEPREDGELRVLFVARLSAPKGLFDLFDAIPRVLEAEPRARFLLMGVAETADQEPKLRAEVERRGIGSRVTFLGSLEGPAVARAYADADLLVVPSWTEAFPLVIPEGMAAGLPIVASAVGAIPDFVHDGEEGLLFPARDSAALAERIVRLLRDEPLRRRIAAHVRERAVREFAVECGARRVARVIRGLLEAETTRPAAAGRG